jgi:hypothetical protein
MTIGLGEDAMPGGLHLGDDTQVEARAMFTRMLSAWASDLLSLRRTGLDVPGHRAGTADLVTPSFIGPGSDQRWAGSDVAAALRWRPAAA